MPKAMTLAIGLLGTGYALGLTLAVLGCTEENTYWLLFLFFPYMLTPMMTIFLDIERGDGWFWNQFAGFIASFSVVTAFAMPLTFYNNDGIGGVGLGFGLGADVTLYGFLAVGLYYAYKKDYSF